MTRLFVIATVIVVALMVYALVDAAFLDRSRVRGMPKPVWLAIIVLLPLVGALLWFFVGRGPRRSPGSGSRRPVAPDDDPEFLRSLNFPKPEDETDKTS